MRGTTIGVQGRGARLQARDVLAFLAAHPAAGVGRGVWSDVHEFPSLLKSDEGVPPDEAKRLLATALDLYRGDLLLSPEYDWVHTRLDSATLREHYRSLWR